MLATVTSVDPLANSLSAPVAADVSATFDEVINAASATNDNFVVRAFTRPTATTVTAAGMTVTADPTTDFLPGEFVQVTATAGIQGTTAATPHVWQFRTQVTSGSGEFVDSGQALGGVDAFGVSAALGDLDGDGDLDLHVSKYTQQNEVWFNDGNANFTNSEQNLGGGITSEAVFGDIDGDGDLDVVIANVNQLNEVWQNDGTGTFTRSQTLFSSGTEGVSLADLDGDGDLEIFFANRGAPNRVFVNDGSGNFTDSGQRLAIQQSTEVELGDLDGDGDIDAAVGNYFQPNRIWLNDGNGVFSDSGQLIGTNNRSSGLGIGDLDGDGDLDMVEANFSYGPGGTGTKVFFNEGGVFVESGQALGGNRMSFSVAMGDVDGDGDLDFVVGNNDTNGVYINDGAGNITQPDLGNPGTDAGTRRSPLGDLDGDGDLDIVAANTSYGNPPGSRVFLNQNLAPSVTLSVDQATIIEEAGAATITATLSAAHTQGVTVDLGFSGSATDGTDYAVSGTQIVIPVGATTGSVTVTAVQDTVDEPDESVIIEIANVANAQEAGSQQVTVTILDDDEAIVVPDVVLSVDNAEIAEAGGVATFAVTLSEVTSVPVTVDLEITGTAAADDYSASGTQVVIAPGATAGSVTVTAVDDTEDESDETVVVSVAGVTGGNEVGEQQQTTTITDDDTRLTVTALTPIASGFVAEFSTNLNTSLLNLYDTQSAGLGPADVVLQGASIGPVAGSLLLDASLRKVTFIKSGAPLAADTYTVTMRSGADGFVDSDGQQLDGNEDGTEGDDYTNTFAVAEAPANAVTIGIPDIVRGPGQDVNLPADETNGIPVTISEGMNVRAVDLRVAYDPALLTITGGTVGTDAPAGASVIVNTSTPGLAIVVFFSTNPLLAGSGTFVNLQASVPATDPSGIYGTQQRLDLHEVIVSDGNDNEAPVVVDDALHLASFFSDVSGNGRTNAADASAVARFAALIDGGFVGSPNADPTVVGDISGNGRVNAADASLLAQFAALINVPQIPAIPGGIVITGFPNDRGAPIVGLPASESDRADAWFPTFEVIHDFPSADSTSERNRAVDRVMEELEGSIHEDLDDRIDLREAIDSLLSHFCEVR